MRKRMKKITISIKRMATDLGILNRHKKSRMGKRTKEMKMAMKKGKRTGLASLRMTPAMKMTIIRRLPVVTLFDSIEAQLL